MKTQNWKKYLVAKPTNVHEISISSNKKVRKQNFANVSLESESYEQKWRNIDTFNSAVQWQVCSGNHTDLFLSNVFWVPVFTTVTVITEKEQDNKSVCETQK